MKGIFILPHAQKRMSERGITPAMVDLALQYGRKLRAPQSLYLFVGRRNLEKMKLVSKGMDHLEGVTLVLDPSGQVMITCFKNKNFPKKIRNKK